MFTQTINCNQLITQQTQTTSVIDHNVRGTASAENTTMYGLMHHKDKYSSIHHTDDSLLRKTCFWCVASETKVFISNGAYTPN